MASVVLGIFLLLHGAVHLLYLGQSVRLFDLKPGMAWPDHAWAFGGVASPAPARVTAAGVCGAAAVGFVAGGIALLAGQAWWREVVLLTAVLATAGFLVLWDATVDDLPGQGAVAVAINAVLAVSALLAPGLGVAG